MKKIGLLISLVFLTSMAIAGFHGYQSTTDLGNFNSVKCSTGLTCTKAGDKFVMVSSPAISTSSLSLSSTLSVTGDVAVNTNKFNVTAASGNTAIAGTANVVGNFSIATNKFNVTAASGNTTVAGTLGVTGDVAVNTNKFTVTASSGNTLVAGTLAVTGASTFTGAVTHTGGIVASSGTLKNFMGWKPSTLTAGTSTTPSATVVYLTQVYIPANATLTGVYLNNGATVGTNKYIVALFDSSGAVVANSTLSGITTSGADAYQVLAFTGTYAAVGPATYWIGIYVNGTTDRFRSVPAVGQYAGYTGSVSAQTFGTVATITPPTTFTADVGPVAFTY